MADRINHGVLVGVIVAITILGGVLQGTLANRWGTPADMEAAAARVDALKESMKQRGKKPCVIVAAVANRWMRHVFHQMKEMPVESIYQAA